MECSRLACDLHDGLGGMLWVVKHSLFNVKEGLITSTEGMERFDRAILQLDQSIGELRNFAHNPMPESLIKEGIQVALSDFTDGLPNVQSHFYGKLERVDTKLEVVVYRIAHELIFNAIKHSNAQAINLQVVQSEKNLTLTVADNGIGFNLAEIEHNKGMGLSNVNQRVTSFGGRIDIVTSPNNGCEVTVEFDLV